ncbi:copper/zinc superoxide dismutase [Saprolegnia parasitica CBS 223.65]|uniref:superoxide dismutase n=1 Tax=Saprolegnia parasitica (strain CBS 223.65) TaxID=695850 RepID=A0A067BVQ6_SAPPC|nr:copper/zinc superoxide dismutase [Saprolegnia parasitica CBS 223.65]KDO20930.1 copper/zinc superoxide dismutase [Saprolegnia parasitica CBS 223.65]|eukprot:XP_012208322.1 copper/zinc superoxide dismutase [Saprolegnia parasitica CBS 223.65]
MAKAVVTLYGDDASVYGSLVLSQSNEDAKTLIVGNLKGLSAGKHALHINVFGDVSNGGASTGGVFNPFGKAHGAPEDEERRVGSLGNIQVDDEGNAKVHVEDALLKLIGPHSVIGRSLVIHENEDDLGKGGHELSLQNGNAGPIKAFGVIGISA